MSDGKKLEESVQLPKELLSLIEEEKLSREKAELWVKTKDRVSVCDLCGLDSGCTRKVFGIGNIKAPFLFVAEAPGSHEDMIGEPFIGRAGKYIRKIMQTVGFRRGDVYITYTVKCRPPENRTPTGPEVGNCFMHLWNQLEVIQPKIIIAVGSVALKALVPKCKRALGGCRGDWMNSYGYKLIPVWHPSYVLQSHMKLREQEFKRDLTKAYKEVFAVEG